MKKFTFILLLVLGNGWISLEADEALIPRKILFGNPVKASPQVSPDGKKLAYLAPDDNNVMNIWVAPLDHLNEAKIVTSDKKRGIRCYNWHSDSTRFLYIQDKDGDENWHLYQTDIISQKTTDLTPYSGVRTEIIRYSNDHPEKILVGMNLRDKTVNDVHLINLKSGETTLVMENRENVISWEANRDLQVVLSHTYDPNGGLMIKKHNENSSRWEMLMHFDFEDSMSGTIGFAENNNQLLLVSSKGSDTARMIQLDLENGKETVLAEDPDYDIGNAVLHPETHRVEAATLDREKPAYIFLNKDFGKELVFLQKTLKTPVFVTSRDLKDTKWVVISVSDTRPAHYYLYDKNKKSLKFLFSQQPQLSRYKLNPTKPISFHARDGLKIHGYLTKAKKGKGKKKPAVLLVHGGPWTRDRWGMDTQAKWLSDRGYNVLQLNYRGSTGYGKKFVNAGNKEWAKKMHDDLLDGVDWLVKNGHADRDKIAIFGGSYGGYATLVGLAFTPEVFCCGVDIVGPSNLLTLLRSLPPYWTPTKKMMDIRVGKVETEEEMLRERSPLFKADKITKPLLIAQGAHDPRVKQQESDQLAAAMRSNGKEVVYLLFPDEGHGFAVPHNRMKFFAAAEEFLSQHLGGKKEPTQEEDDWTCVLQK